MSGGPADQAETRSVHGGRLPVDEQMIRAEAFAQIFGGSRRSIGRFEVLRTLGAGGMGTVFAAHDAALDRTVAIKIVREVGGADPEVLRRRMQREAKALAQLGHPNVVAVYEVGTYDEGIFIAMEYVDGPSLRAWLAEADRSSADIVAAYVAAGRGLAAAHRRGIIHRDFKPDNVIVDREEQRPRVADFGLATAAEEPGHNAPPRPSPRPPSGDPQIDSGQTVGGSTGITSHGTQVGTPAYMSPEQRRGEALTAASDQYSFCVALAEALLGERPQSAAELDPANALDQPLRAALTRGLAADPERRWPDLDCLLEQLEPRPSRKGWVIGGGAAVVSLGLVFVASRSADCDRPPPLRWPQIESELGEQLLTAEPAYVADTWPVVRTELERHAAGWEAAVQEACAARDARSTVQQHVAMQCLSRRSARFEAVVAGLGSETKTWAPVAVAMVSSLPEATTCNAAARLDAGSAPNEGDHANPDLLALDKGLLSAQLAFARARSGAVSDTSGLLDQGARAAGAVVEDAEQAGDAEAEGEGLRLLGQVALRSGDATEAAERFARAAAAAERAGDVRGRARALSLQAYAVGQDRARLDEAQRLAAQALAALDGVGDDPWVRAHILNALGSISARARPPRLTEAIDAHRRAVALFSKVAGPRHPETLQARLNLGAALNRAGDSDAALEELDDAVLAVAQVWGEQHPTYARARRIRGLARLRAGQPVAAADDIRRSLRIHREAFGASHPEVASDLYNLALALRQSDANADARDALLEGLHIREAQLGPKHPELIPWLLLLGRVHVSSGHADAAVPVFERALALCELDGALPFEFARLRLLLAEALVGAEPLRARVLATQAQGFFNTVPTHRKRLARAEAVLSATATDESRPDSAEPARSR